MSVATPLFSSVEEPPCIDFFKGAEEAVRVHSNNHPQVLAECRHYLDVIRDLQREGKLSQEDTMRILNAVAFSAEKHQYQKRKNLDQTPYIIHPIGVSYTLATLGNVHDADVLIGALLHDTVEDTETSFEEIHQVFGSEVEGYVREVTDDKSLPKEERKQRQIDHAKDKSAGAALIKLSDKLYNLSDVLINPPAGWSSERIDQYFLWAQQVVDNLPNVNAELKQTIDEVIASYFKNRKP